MKPRCERGISYNKCRSITPEQNTLGVRILTVWNLLLFYQKISILVLKMVVLIKDVCTFDLTNNQKVEVTGSITYCCGSQSKSIDWRADIELREYLSRCTISKKS